MKTRNYILLVVAIIVFSNILPFRYFFGEEYHYQNADGSFQYTEMPGKGLDYEVGRIRFDRFKEKNLMNKNTVLYRTFTLKPWRFWEWIDMVKNYKRYQPPKL